jgi:hypothetical protein
VHSPGPSASQYGAGVRARTVAGASQGGWARGQDSGAIADARTALARPPDVTATPRIPKTPTSTRACVRLYIAADVFRLYIAAGHFSVIKSFHFVRELCNVPELCKVHCLGARWWQGRWHAVARMPTMPVARTPARTFGRSGFDRIHRAGAVWGHGPLGRVSRRVCQNDGIAGLGGAAEWTIWTPWRRRCGGSTW